MSLRFFNITGIIFFILFFRFDQISNGFIGVLFKYSSLSFLILLSLLNFIHGKNFKSLNNLSKNIFFIFLFFEFFSFFISFYFEKLDYIFLFKQLVFNFILYIYLLSVVINFNSYLYFYKTILNASFFYVLLNIVLVIFNVNSTAIDKNVDFSFGFDSFENAILNGFGLSNFKLVVYPLSSGVKGLFALSSCLVVYYYAKFIRLRSKNLFRSFAFALAFAICLGVVISVDSRFSFFIILLVIIISTIASTNTLSLLIKSSPFWAWALPICVILLILIIYDFAWIIGFARSSSVDNLITLSGRTFIWVPFFENYDMTIFNVLFGYGAYGQVSSGIQEYFSFLFDSRSDTSIKSMHNIYLQIFVERGFLGLVFFVSSFCFVLNNLLSQSTCSTRFSLSLFFFACLLIGQVETIPHYSPFDFYYIFTMLFIFALFDREP